ncbi:MAG: hypothetical protein HY018_11480 [Hydrogenophilales bacterium]|nr:hypothetical protein [Hydrogenophilales bacterium]
MTEELLSIQRSFRAALLIVGAVILDGCNPQYYTPQFEHKNFVESVNHMVGEKLEDVEKIWSGLDPAGLKSETVLPNGDLAYHYKFGDCLYTFDIDPVTHIIHAVHVESSACRMNI